MLVMMLPLLLLLAVALSFVRATWTHHRGYQAALLTIIAGAALMAAWRIAFPQANVDFDTWMELARFKHHLVGELVKRHRPLQYLFEYYLVSGLSLMQPDLVKCWAGIVVACFLLVLVTLTAFRRTLFRSSRVEYPIICYLAFALSPAGEFLIDSWNDHMPLVPLYVCALALLLKYAGSPRRTAWWLLLCFTGYSLMHSAEPWLWAPALIAVLAVRRARTRRALQTAVVLLVLMAAASLAILSVFPGGTGAVGLYMGNYVRPVLDAESFRLFAHGFALGGAADVRARYLVPMLTAVVAALVLTAWWRRKPADWIFAALALGALLFPLVYESTNPERHWIAGLLWAVIGTRFLRLGQALLRSSHYRKAAVALFVPFLMLVGIAAHLPAMMLDLNSEAVYNSQARELARRLDPRGSLVIRPDSRNAFYVWEMYWFPGRVVIVQPSDRVTAVASALNPPVYLENAAALLAATEGTSTSAILVCPGLPETAIHAWNKDERGK